MYFVECKNNYNTGYYLKDTTDGVSEFYTTEQVEIMRDRGLNIKGFYKCGVHPVVPVGRDGYCYVGEGWGDGHYDGYIYSSADISASVGVTSVPIKLFVAEDPYQNSVKINKFTGYVYDICGDNRFLLQLDGFEHMEEIGAKFIGSFVPSIPLRCFFHSNSIRKIFKRWLNTNEMVSYEKPESCRRAIYMSSRDFIPAIVRNSKRIREKTVYLEDKDLYIDCASFQDLFTSIYIEIEGLYSWDQFSYCDFSWDSLRAESPELYEFCKLVEGVYVPASMLYGNDKEYCSIEATSKGALVQCLEVSDKSKKVICKKERLVDIRRNGEWSRLTVSNPDIAIFHLLGETRAVYTEPLLEDNGYGIDSRVKAKRKVSGVGDCELTESGDLLRCSISPSGVLDIPEGTKRICTGSLVLNVGEVSALKGIVFPKSLEEIEDCPIKAKGLFGNFQLDCSKQFICWKSTKRGLFRKFIGRLETHKYDLGVGLYKSKAPRPDFFKLNLCNRVEVIGGLLGTELGEILTGVQGYWHYGDKAIFNSFISQLKKVDSDVLLKDLENCFKLYVKTPRLDAGRFNILKKVVKATVGKEVTGKYGYIVHSLPNYSNHVDLRSSLVADEYEVFQHFKEIFDSVKDYLPVDRVGALDELVSNKWLSFSQYRLNYVNWLTTIGVYDYYTQSFDKQKFIRLYRSGKFD